MTRKEIAFTAIAVVMAIALLAAAANPVSAQQGINDMWNAILMHSTLRVQGAATFDSGITTTGAGAFTTLVSGADAAFTDDATVADDAYITGTLTVGNV